MNAAEKKCWIQTVRWSQENKRLIAGKSIISHLTLIIGQKATENVPEMICFHSSRETYLKDKR